MSRSLPSPELEVVLFRTASYYHKGKGEVCATMHNYYLLLHYSAQIVIMNKKFLSELREHMLKEMEVKHWDMTEMAIQCDISYRNLQSILYGERKDVKLSTITKICEVLHFHLFVVDDKADDCIEKIEKITDKHKQSIYDYVNYIYDTGRH